MKSTNNWSTQTSIGFCCEFTNLQKSTKTDENIAKLGAFLHSLKNTYCKNYVHRSKESREIIPVKLTEEEVVHPAQEHLIEGLLGIVLPEVAANVHRLQLVSNKIEKHNRQSVNQLLLTKMQSQSSISYRYVINSPWIKFSRNLNSVYQPLLTKIQSQSSIS